MLFKFYFEIKQSLEVVKKYIGRYHVPYTLPPPVLASCLTVVQYQHNEIHICTTLELIEILPVMHTLIYVCVFIVQSMLSCVTLYNYHHNKNSQQFHHHKFPFIYLITPLPSTL